jgi:D-arabinose 1-dehydrogenase-like Zn-dependent alcohol dehydrogenase
MCAGVATFDALRHSGALPSDLVAVRGTGGLDHRGIQFAKNFGYRVAAVGRGPSNAAPELQRLDARVILATAPNSKAMSSLVDGLGANGTMMVVGCPIRSRSLRFS